VRGERAWDGKGEAKMLTGLGLWGRRLGRKEVEGEVCG